jgi:glucuronokinase
LPPLYIAYSTDASEPTEVFHNDIRGRFNRGEQKVVRAMARFAALAMQAREAILARDAERLARLMDENFDTRRSIYNLPARQVEMVERARRVGASAKFAGSGGAIVGMHRDEAMFQELQKELGAIHCRVLKPILGDSV